MVKILGGLVAAIVIAVGGFFGFEFYVQHRIVNEIDGVFEQIRATGGKASHGKVSFDLLNRTVTIADIATQTAAQHPVSVKIASTQVDGFTFTATTLEKGKTQKIAGDLTNLTMLDFDAMTIAATFDPQRANDDRYYRAYRQFSVGSYVLTPGQGMRMRIEGLT